MSWSFEIEVYQCQLLLFKFLRLDSQNSNVIRAINTIIIIIIYQARQAMHYARVVKVASDV